MNLYNEEFKERFLSQYENEDTQKTIRNVFLKSELIEGVLEKDLANFNLTEIGKCISNSDPHTVSVAKSIGRFISQYLSFAIENGYREGSNINPLKGVDDSYYENFVDKSKKIHYSLSEFLELLEDKDMLNYQDKSFLFLAWNGIIGEKFLEMQHLKKSDINFDTNEVYIASRDKNVKISEEGMKYLEKACSENTYYQFNSETREFKEMELLDSPYLFRNIKSPRSKENETLKINVFYSRVHALKSIFNLEYLSPNSIKQSGMIKMAVDIYLRDGELAYEQLAEIGERYEYSMITNNNHTYYNTFLMRQFLSSEIISDLYNIDVEIKLR